MSASPSLLRRYYSVPPRLPDRTVRVRYGSEPTVRGILSVRTRYVRLGALDAGAVLTPTQRYRTRIFRERRYYVAMHCMGFMALVLAYAFAGWMLAVAPGEPRAAATVTAMSAPEAKP